MQTFPSILLAVSAASSTPPDVQLELAGQFIVQGHAARIRLADLDRNGLLDLVLRADPGIVAKLNAGDGVFGPDLGSSLDAEFGFAVGDVDGDRRPDALAGNAMSDGVNLAVVSGQGNGFFVSEIALSNGSGATPTVGIGDVNGDGLGDLLSNTFGGVSTRLCLGSRGSALPISARRFAPPIFSGATGVVGDPIVRDVNADGRLDCLHVSDSGNVDIGLSRLYVNLGNGDGTFVHVQTLDLGLRVGGNAVVPRYELARLDEDALPDLVVFGFPGNHAGSGGLRLLQNLGGTFAVVYVETQAELGTTTIQAPTGDFDGDGLDDVLILRKPDGVTEIRLSDGDFDFRNQTIVVETPFQYPWEAKAAVVADLVGSPLPDVLYLKVPGGPNDLYFLYENVTPP